MFSTQSAEAEAAEATKEETTEAMEKFILVGRIQNAELDERTEKWK